MIFGLLDINQKGVLDIVLLMQLYNNVNRNTMFGQEILKIIREYKSKNILLKGGYRRKIVLNFSTFVKLVNHSCLIEMLQYKIFGVYVPEKKLVEDTGPPTFKKYTPIKKPVVVYVYNKDLTFQDCSTLVAFSSETPLPPPARPPFKFIEGLEQILEREEMEVLRRQNKMP